MRKVIYSCEAIIRPKRKPISTPEYSQQHLIAYYLLGGIDSRYLMLVAYLSITDNKSKVGNSATLSLFKKLCISREVTGAQKPPASSFDAASVQSAGVGPQSALTRLNAPGKGDRFNPHNEL